VLAEAADALLCLCNDMHTAFVSQVSLLQQ
jgi:hypothetical protein